jgi:CHRD domain
MRLSLRPMLCSAAALVAVLGLGAQTASAQTYTLTATLTGAGENPAINTGAFGSATVTVDMSAKTVTYRVDVYNLPSGVTASHIHAGAIGTNGPVVVNFAPPVPASNDFGFSGTVRDTEFVLRPDQGIRSADDMFQAILGENSYVNVHSTVNGGGEVRGQLLLLKK